MPRVLHIMPSFYKFSHVCVTLLCTGCLYTGMLSSLSVYVNLMLMMQLACAGVRTDVYHQQLQLHIK